MHEGLCLVWLGRVWCRYGGQRPAKSMPDIGNATYEVQLCTSEKRQTNDPDWLRAGKLACCSRMDSISTGSTAHCLPQLGGKP